MNRRIFTLALASISSGLPAMAEEAARPPADAVNFESLDQVKALAAKGPAIVWFHAEWCPVCHHTMTNFRARWHEVQPGITLVIADYDTAGELKTSYGVTYQNTFLQIGEDGAKLAVWNGGGIEALNEKPVFAKR